MEALHNQINGSFCPTHGHCNNANYWDFFFKQENLIKLSRSDFICQYSDKMQHLVFMCCLIGLSESHHNIHTWGWKMTNLVWFCKLNSRCEVTPQTMSGLIYRGYTGRIRFWRKQSSTWSVEIIMKGWLNVLLFTGALISSTKTTAKNTSQQNLYTEKLNKKYKVRHHDKRLSIYNQHLSQ